MPEYGCAALEGIMEGIGLRDNRTRDRDREGEESERETERETDSRSRGGVDNSRELFRSIQRLKGTYRLPEGETSRQSTRDESPGEWFAALPHPDRVLGLLETAD